jgi:23S rRNA pseudouridine1911/1915/1917 synthase
MHIAVASAPGAQAAELSYRVLGRKAGEPAVRRGVAATLLEVRPVTGRKHQIRVQLSHAGFPILGDRKYGGLQGFPEGIGLHARRLVIEHPVSKMQLEVLAPVPASWSRFLETNQVGS